MSKHIKLFDTETQYTNSHPETNTETPIVYYIKDNKNVIYDSDAKTVILAKTLNITPYKKLVYDGEDVRFLDRYNRQLYTGGTISGFPSASYYLNLNSGATFKVYTGYGTYSPDVSGGRYFYYFNQQGPSTHSHMGQNKPVTWSYDTYTIVTPELFEG